MENYADATKKSNGNAVTEGRINTATNNKDNVQQYYEQLCKKFSRMNINTSGGITSSSKNNIVLNFFCLFSVCLFSAFSTAALWFEPLVLVEAGNEMGEYTISVTGMDIGAVTEKIIAAVSGISVPTGASFDIKA